MNKNIEKMKIEKLVFRVFMKHVKANNLYAAFRLSVNHNKAYNDIVHVLFSRYTVDKYSKCLHTMKHIGGTIFINANSINDILTVMHNDSRINIDKNDRNTQMYIMNLVNVLIHNCIEHALVNNMMLIEKIGSAIFEEVGKKLFGEDFKDLTNEGLDPKQVELMERLRNAQNRAGFSTQMSSKKMMELLFEMGVIDKSSDNFEDGISYYEPWEY